MGQHRMYQKMEMYEQAIRVPLIFRLPGAGHQTVTTPVSHLDVMPTLLSLLDLPEPGDLDGTSLRETIAGGGEPPARPVFSQFSGTLGIGDIRRAVIDGRHKYVYDPEDEPELYDLESDPLETTNLAADPARAGLVRDLHAQCRAWHAAHGDWVDF
jgi:arylsulfatase A-like enzyme